MFITKDIHFKEDTAKPENRVNLSLFHLMMIDNIRNYVLDKLKISREVIVYPSPNLTTQEFDSVGRPDLAIKKGDKLIGYIEVEIGPEDSEQLKRYRNQPLPVYSIIGKRSYGECDLSLEELYHYLKSIQSQYRDTQHFQSMHLLISLIDYYVIQGNVYHQKPIYLSENMKASKLVKHFFEYFGNDRVLENAPVERNKIMFNTRGENGFSLRVFSPETNSGGFSLMNRTAGRRAIYFPSYNKLLKYLPDKKPEVEQYSELIAKLGAQEIWRIEETKRCSLQLEIIETNVQQFCRAINEIIKI